MAVELDDELHVLAHRAVAVATDLDHALAALADNDAYNAFRAVNGLFITGPTGTNVNDFRAIIVR